MTHHELYDTHTLRICNHPATNLTTNSNGFFSVEIPNHLRERDCFAHVISGTVGDLDSIFEGTEDSNLVILRHNIGTFSYDVTSKGTNRSFGTVIRPANSEKIAKINEDNELDLGRIRLPAQLEVESIGFITATGAEVRLDKASHFVEVILRLEFPK
jgi:hypothetical protein